MQLLVILALLLMGGNNNGKNIFSEVKPVIESFGGEEMKQALKSAEEISEMITAVQGLAGSVNNVQSGSVNSTASGNANVNSSNNASKSTGRDTGNFPLAPISAIADKDITYALSRYISQN